MKSLLLIRHAKSSWDDFSISDFDRPLNDRGKRDAPVMAQRLLKKNITIDAFISSPAKRARTTAEFFAEAYDVKKETIFFIKELYLATPAVFFNVISRIDNRFNTIALFSHNNGLTDFTNLLTNARIDDIPTCGIAGVKLYADSWQEFENGKKEHWFFDYPKAAE